MTEPMPRVLVCDGEAFFREAIRDILTGEQLDVIDAADGETALWLASDPSIGIVVLDAALSAIDGLDGLDVLRRLREARPDVRVIEALRSGASDYLAKPLHDEELVLAVRRAAESWAVERSWDRLRSQLDRLARQLEAASRRAAEAAPDERAAVIAGVVVQLASDLLDAGRTSLLRVQPDGNSLEVAALHDRSMEQRDFAPIACGDGVAGRVLDAGEPLLVVDIASDERFAELAQPGRYTSGCFAIAPLQRGGRPFGLLCATNPAGDGAFAPEDLGLLRLLASEACALLHGAVESPCSDDEPSEEATDRDVELARSICDAITNESVPEQVYGTALSAIEKRLAAAPVSLYLVDDEGRILLCAASCDGGARVDRPELPVGTGLCGAVFQTGRMVATDTPDLDPRFDVAVDTPIDGAAGPLLCAPLSLRGKVIGVFRAFPSDGAEGLTRTGEVAAAALSAAVRNVLLYRSLLESIDEVAEARRRVR